MRPEMVESLKVGYLILLGFFLPHDNSKELGSFFELASGWIASCLSNVLQKSIFQKMRLMSRAYRIVAN